MAVAERTPILELKGISKRFGAVQALSDVDFEVYAGEAVGLVGDNGAGKSTLVKTIAGSVMWDAKVVMLDEPTAALGVSQTKQVLELIRRLRDQGLAVVVISHNMADVFEVADRIVVMRLGRRVATFDVRKASREEVVSAITGAEFGKIREAPDTDETADGEVQQ